MLGPTGDTCGRPKGNEVTRDSRDGGEVDHPKPNVVITGRVADASLFVAPVLYELGVNQNSDWGMLAAATATGHLLECGCQLTGGYFAHPKGRALSVADMLSLSLPYADVCDDGTVLLHKLPGSGGELSERTCAEQLAYEICDPTSYCTPDVVVDLSNVTFHPVSRDTVEMRGASAVRRPSELLRMKSRIAGWKGFAEISYGGFGCLERAKLAQALVRSWVSKQDPRIMPRVSEYIIGHDSLFVNAQHGWYQDNMVPPREIRLRFDGLFDTERQAMLLVQEVGALYTNGPAGGCGVSSSVQQAITLCKQLLPRDMVYWTVQAYTVPASAVPGTLMPCPLAEYPYPGAQHDATPGQHAASPAQRGVEVLLYDIAHSRAGDKGDTINLSLIPFCRDDFPRVQEVVTRDWVSGKLTGILGKDPQVMVYSLPGIAALNVVLAPALDGGVTISRRIDRHGKSLSDLLLSQTIVL